MPWMTAQTLPSKPLPAVLTEIGGSHPAQSPIRGQRSEDERDVWDERRTFDEQPNHDPSLLLKMKHSERSSGGTENGAPQLLAQMDQRVINPRTSGESQTSQSVESLHALMTTPPNMGHPASEAGYRPSPQNPFRQTKGDPQTPNQSQVEELSGTEIWSGVGDGNINSKMETSLALKRQPPAELWSHSSSTSNQPQQFAHDAPGNENFADVKSSIKYEGCSNGLAESKGSQKIAQTSLTQKNESNSDRSAHLYGWDPINTESFDWREALPTSDPIVPSTGLEPQHNPVPSSAIITRRSENTSARSVLQPPQTIDATNTNALTNNDLLSLEEPPKPRRASETYQIRLVDWGATSSSTNLQRSPIMVQNANGPCPLLALVNALVLSTPTNIKTPLVETLRVREQVSLGLLLDAVIDELMSGRRGDAAQSLPDVSELYAFLLTLHTGMNINPCFVPLDEETVNLIDAPINEPIKPQNLRKPGGFEDTREMKFYRTFAVPLVHGWIPPRTHPACASLKRAAKTYEDAQNIMFREDELEQKLKNYGLSQEERVMLDDIGSVKYFLSSTATQLTGYGLDTINEALVPGTIAILFRNDHFSTLYRHPESGQLFNLVTDMGYAGHDEVVWESLVDVSGEGSKFFAGDFRPVGIVENDIQRLDGHTAQENEERWETVRKRRGKNSCINKADYPSQPSSDILPFEKLNLEDARPALSANIEQQDHDLALAMQLQEEEEERERREAAARRREDELSQAYLNNADAQGRRTFPGFGRGAQGRPTVPPRGGSGTNNNDRSTPSARQAPRRQRSSEDLPPPSYEQAAQGPAYHPPVNHPSHPHAVSPNPGGSTPRSATGRNRQGSSAYSEHAGTYGGNSSTPTSSRRKAGRVRSSGGAGQLEGAPGVVRRRSDMVALVATEEDKKEKDCVVM